jgi:hypothetical protein
VVAATIHPEALEEFPSAIAFYEERVPGLGRAFFNEVQRVVRSHPENPAVAYEFELPYARIFCARFQFGIVYRRTPRGVRILAVMLQRRKPGYWKRRP